MKSHTTPPTARGLRNCNPLNIRHNSDKFQGEIPGTDPNFKTFQTMAYGYRAAFVILGTYHDNGINTIESIITRWAPPSENHTEAYIAHIEKYTNIRRDKRLYREDGPAYILIVAAMSFVENGVSASITEVQKGFKLQSKFTTPWQIK